MFRRGDLLAAAGLADDDGEGGNVEDVEVGFDDCVDAAAGEQVVVQKIGVAANAVQLGDEPAELGPVGRGRQGCEVAG